MDFTSVWNCLCVSFCSQKCWKQHLYVYIHTPTSVMFGIGRDWITNLLYLVISPIMTKHKSICHIITGYMATKIWWLWITNDKKERADAWYTTKVKTHCHDCDVIHRYQSIHQWGHLSVVLVQPVCWVVLHQTYELWLMQLCDVCYYLRWVVWKGQSS